MASKFCETIRDFCTNSTLTGVHYISDKDTHWTEKLFWMAMISGCWYSSGLLILTTWSAFRNNPISFGVETNFIEWQTEFPAVAICEHQNVERVYLLSDTLWTLDHPIDLEEVLKELAYFRGTSFYTLQFCNKPNPDPRCPKSNFSYLANLVRSDCKSTISDCSYNSKSFSCCDHFLQIQTDIGLCYVVNSIQVRNNNHFKMVSNRETKLGKLVFHVHVPGRLYTIGEVEVPGLTTLQSSTITINGGVSYRRHLALRNIENDPLAVETNPTQRACRYRWEQDEDNAYPYYSYSTCVVRCRRLAQLKYCNCTDHFIPGSTEEERCGLEGLKCLNKHYTYLAVLKPAWSNREGLYCDCLPSCTETDITVVQNVKTSIGGPFAVVEINLEYLPTERFKRNVVRSRLDLVVSVGGTTGLFLGASLLSFVELIHYLTIRLCGSIYMHKQKKSRQTSVTR